MVIKAVFFDIDGTLLNDRKNVQQSTLKAINSLKKQGIFVGVATGRGPGFVQPYLENLGLDFAISYNGQYIFTRDQVLYHNQMAVSTVYRLIRYANDHRREISLGTASGLVGSRIINIQNAFPCIKVTRSSPYSADLISKGQSKVKGIERVGEMFGFSLDEVMAFGDSDNDIEMLSGVGISVAMGNAIESVKSVATYTTDTNNNDGISKALAHYGLIHVEVGERFDSQDDNFNKVKYFHHQMDGETCETPRLYGVEEADHRSDFKVEEIVEFLYATSKGNPQAFQQSVTNLHEAVDKAVTKIKSKEHPETPLLGQVDALTDLLYLTYGSFVLMGVDPKPFFDIVHESNMGKIFPDGQAHFDPTTHKILKPDDWEEKFAPEPAIKRELDRQIQKSLNRKKRNQASH